jgi:lipopolysaccharide export system protein LptA
MSQPNKFLVVKRASFALGALAVTLLVGAVVETVVHIDPFAGLKQTSKDVDPKLGVRIEGVKLESYEGEKLVTQAEMDRMDIRQDKQHYDLFGVRKGVFYSEKGALQFDAPRAEWIVPSHQLEAPQGAHVKDKNVDLNVPHFAFKSDKGDVRIPGSVSGKLNDGQVNAKDILYNVNSGMITTGPIRWKGKIALQQDGDDGKPRTWSISGDSYRVKGEVRSWVNGIAFDGEIKVTADNVDLNSRTDVIVATGHVHYFSSKANMSCEKAIIERKIKKATLTGDVLMLLKAKESQVQEPLDEGIPPYRPIVPEEIAKTRPQAEQSGQTEEQKKLDEQIRSGKNMREYPTICHADQVIYYYKPKERHAEISGHPQARQEMAEGAWRHIWSTTGHYDGEKETLKLLGTNGALDVRMMNSIGDDITTDWATVSTKEGEEDMEGGKVKGSFVGNSDDFPRDSRKVPNITPPTTGGGQKPPPPANKTNTSLSGAIGKNKKKG